MNPDAMLWLRATAYTTVALLTCLLLRRPLRSWLGATAAYAIWASVPLALLAAVIPGPPMGAVVVRMPALAAIPFASDSAASAPDVQQWLVAVWLAGAVLSALILWRGQHRFLRSLGPLHAVDQTLWLATHDVGLPASLGILRPRIVLPIDFTTRYSADERALILAHERLHLRRGDLQANLLATVLLCIGWFNPLLHLAWRAFRLDQELACDAAVLARHPGKRRSYAGAMLKCQLGDRWSPLACHWATTHPLTQRIAALRAPTLRERRARWNMRMVITFAAVASLACWVIQPARPSATLTPGNAVDFSTMRPPRYPAEALAANLAGLVELQIDVSASGAPDHVVIVHSRPAGVFDQAVLEAARHWHFKPAIADGKPVASRVRVPVRFELDTLEQPGASRDAGRDERLASQSSHSDGCAASAGCARQGASQ
ncbi:TonB family protein [Xanthomonas vesicatoria]|uniref:Protein TonB n=1 Tax=Xanthomonas vesicatoria TaxID=56460 RepID=A0AAJ0N3L3_9XANT|nr:TonB family protein [Xanthomonas vesicatoria]APO94946.1 energy transducer TonB [Xanthomonas vesicatoria]KHM93645.1 energy transducer TonB [Xanthomonas vesicatoria]KHM94745.1 energy transducer TonB [Xanthomonas vesicatoria]MCC8621459.1 TonB family protein [Xanthomonas vesicatoria]MCC8693546.1 TonB family protein [Xanthomonas vesicatoria]